MAARTGETETAALLLEAGAQVDAREKSFDATPLFVAADEGHAETASLLIDHGADVDARDNRGLTPVHQAAIKGNVVTLATLLQNGADANAQEDKFGATPLRLAQAAKETEAVKLLQNHGNREDMCDAQPSLFAHTDGATSVHDNSRRVAIDRMGDVTTPWHFAVVVSLYGHVGVVGFAALLAALVALVGWGGWEAGAAGRIALEATGVICLMVVIVTMTSGRFMGACVAVSLATIWLATKLSSAVATWGWTWWLVLGVLCLVINTVRVVLNAHRRKTAWRWSY
jgi:hypothetical protein